MLKDQFPQLTGDEVYADWTGAALAPVSLIDAWHQHLRTNLLGNPHSTHRPSMRAMHEINLARETVLRFFNASPDKYEVIFTPNATGAIRILEHYLFNGGELLLTAVNHNSVNGLRETARRGGAIVRYAPINGDLSLNEEALGRMLAHPRSTGNRLFAMPAKSNYCGTVYNLDWVRRARQHGCDVLLDAAAYNANDRLDLSRVEPDFVPVSFYKMFGFPTGVGCLIIHKEAFRRLHKKWFTGGSILLVSVAKDFFVPEPLNYARFEDGTINFAQIPAIINGLNFLERLGGTKSHAVALATSLYDQLVTMRAGRGSIVIHSPRGNDTVTFSVKRDAQIVDAWHFENAASEVGVYVRTGCFCNPGANETTFNYPVEAFEALYESAIKPEDITLDEFRKYSGNAPIGAIRSSFGYANTPANIDRFVKVTRSFLQKL